MFLNSYRPSLGIELSQRQGMVCARNADGKEETRTFPAGNRDHDELLPAIDDVVKSIGATPRELGLIGVDIGPGGFTGLRVSIATAQGIAEISGACVVGVDGATVAAASTPVAAEAEGDVLVLLAAKQESVWAARLVLRNNEWVAAASPGLLDGPPEEWPALVLGDSYLPPAMREAFEENGIRIETPMYDASRLLDLAEIKAQGGETTPPEALLPLYPREPEAVRLWQEKRGYHKRTT